MLRFAFTWKPVSELNWRVMLKFVSSVVAFFSPFLTLDDFFPFTKNWIGNERKRKGQANKRPRRLTARAKYIPCAKRKKSAYSILKCKFLSSEQGNWAWPFFDIRDHSLILRLFPLFHLFYIWSYNIVNKCCELGTLHSLGVFNY